MKIPKCYQAPLRSRKAISQWLTDHRSRGWELRGGGPNYDNRGWLFCFNVKLLQPIDTGFSELLKQARQDGVLSSEHFDDQEWLSAAEKRHAVTNMDSMVEFACETLRRRFVGSDGWPEDEYFSMLPNGSKVRSKFAFLGRSGGWLVLTEFNGQTLTVEKQGGEDRWDAWSFRDLNKLYRFMVMLQHDLQHHKVVEMVKSELAFSFFENICHDLPLTKTLKGERI